MYEAVAIVELSPQLAPSVLCRAQLGSLLKSPSGKDLSSNGILLTSSTSGAMTIAYMSTSFRYSLDRLQRSTRGVVGGLALIAGISACHHSAPPSSRLLPPSESQHAEATRVQLQALAVTTDQEAAAQTDAGLRAQKQMQAATIRARLRDGDFDVGDRVFLSIRTDSMVSDTVVVRAGRVIKLPNLPDISLQGVLRSELQEYLTTQLTRYIKRPDVQTTSLVRVAVMGAVSKPGFYQLPADIALADAIMMAGGPTQNADVDRTQVKRGSDVVYSSTLLGQEVAKGATLDQLNIRPGDQIVIGERHHTNFALIASIVGITAGLISTIVVLRRH
ncbi:MAG: SLBB domain-containing protein [Gemmatimonadota bacterium]